MREKGLYWIKLKGEWIVGKWSFWFDDDEESAGNWFVFGSEWWFDDIELDEVGDPVFTPDKYRNDLCTPTS